MKVIPCFLLACAVVFPTDLSAGAETLHPRRFFADESFWNQPLPADPNIDPRSAEWIELLKTDPSGQNFGINIDEYTIPIYRVTKDTPTAIMPELSDRWQQSPEFEGQPIPIPPNFQPSPGSDQHLTMVDYERGIIWDMWHVARNADGAWGSYTGMIYDLDGPGVFDPDRFPVRINESIHFYGPGRAAGVPVLAGTILYDEVRAGRIRHKLACAVRFVAYQEYVYPPAIWTDGNFGGGLPEGATLQLDPALDLDRFDLTAQERVIACALQEYGMVIVDFAAGNALYAEGLWYDGSRSWEGLVRDWEGGISSIPLDHYRVLDVGVTRKGGDRIKRFFQELLFTGESDAVLPEP